MTHHLDGFGVRAGKKGNLVIEIDYRCNPAKDAAWAAKKKASYPSDMHWRREMERDWLTTAGAAYYPDFMERPQLYIWPCKQLLDAPIVRGWDPGDRGASCVLSQYDPIMDRLFIIREVLLRGCETHDLRDLVLYLCGQLPFEELARRDRVPALRYVEALNADPDPRLHTPWFEPHPIPHFVDFGGHEMNDWSVRPEKASEKWTHGRILAEGGVHVSWTYRGPAARSSIFRRLMKIRPDGHPGLIVDPVCRVLIRGFAGALCFKKGTVNDPEPEAPQKDGTHDHVHDAAGYGATNVVPEAEPEHIRDGRVIVPDQSSPERSADYRTPPWAQQPHNALAIKELLRPNWS